MKYTKNIGTLVCAVVTSVIALSCCKKGEIMRTSEYPINPLILNRWSPRAMSGEPLAPSEFMSLLEAARWAPSSYNNQPWRFIYGFRGTPAWDKLFNLLVPFNQGWAKDGSVLVLVISSKIFAHNQQPSATHSFDTGAACENFALQGASQGLVVHGMAGFDSAAARAEFAIPENYAIEAMFCVGKPGALKNLGQELQEREKPSDRKKVSEFAQEGEFIP